MNVPERTSTVAKYETIPFTIRPLRLGYRTVIEDQAMVTSTMILKIIYKYRLVKVVDAHDRWAEGTPKFLNTIETFVTAQNPVRMCMPAFPFKSANKVFKVLGALPDRAEEAALARLDTMCAEIGAIYKPGARLLIVSDGLVYNDLLTISDKQVWAYGQELRAMAAKSYQHIEFSRLRDLVSIQLPAKLEEVTYVANASNFRRALLNQFGKDGLDVHKEITEQEDTRLTYCGHSRFLTNDLRYIFPKSETRGSNKYKSDVKFLAREMIRRGFAFSAAIKKNFPEYLRLSIHQSTGEHKISLSLLPTTTSYTTPWMCAIAYRADGSLTSAPKGEFEADAKYQVVYVDGRPSFFEEKSVSTIIQETSADDTSKTNAVAQASSNETKSGSTGPCPHCGRSTHPESRCFDKYPHLAPRWVQKRIAPTKMETSDISDHKSSIPVT